MTCSNNACVQCLLIAPEVVASLVKGVDPKTACTAIKLCTAQHGTTTCLHIPLSQKSSTCLFCCQCHSDVVLSEQDDFLFDTYVQIRYFLCIFLSVLCQNV